MTIASAASTQVLQEILKLDINTCTVEFCIAARKDNDSLPAFQRLRLTEPLKQEFRTLLSTFLFDYQKQLHLHNLRVLDFDVLSRLDAYQVEHIDLSKQPYDHITQQSQPLETLHSLDTFKEERSFMEAMRFYVIILLPPQGQPIYFYRRYSPARVLNTSSRLSIQRILGNNDEYESVTTPIFSFDKNIDCIGRDTNLFVLAKNHFYYMFQILDDLIATANDTLNVIQQRIPIANFSFFANSCKRDRSKMQKLTSIARRPYLSRLTISDMKPAITRHHLHIPIIIVEENQQEKETLQFDKDYPWDILKLLDDDYLTSIMTGQDYEIDAKRDL